ncbi:hypothetical protein MTP99_004201 [Tenebrio molitor]|nr:hypothetical protein MTP99_004201 [Tenebrio molitor]
MDLGALKTVLSFGSVLAFTPPKNHNLTISMPRKLYIVTTFIFHVICLTMTLMLKNWHYSQSILLSTVLRILQEVVLFAYSFYTLIVSGLMKRRQWFLLVKNLTRLECEINNEKILYIIFFLSHVMYLAFNVYTAFFWTKALGVIFIKTFILELLPVYSQFFITVLTCVILKMIQSRYKYQKVLLNLHFTHARKQLSHIILLNVKRKLLALKDAVDLFNDIFGWNTLLHIFFIAVRSLYFLDSVIKKENSLASRVPESNWQLVSRSTFILIFWVGLIAVILWCDAIREEYEELLLYCYEMQECLDNSIFEEDDMCAFTKSVSQNSPEFTAARYFYIDRSAIFSIMNSITTFLLVLIQFKSL